MGWIKRNKLFAVSVILALGMLGAAGFYDYQSWSRNDAAFSNLNEIYGKLHGLTGKKISAGNDKVDNIKAARDQEGRLQAWISQARKYFQPIKRIPDASNGALRTEEFKQALDRTIAQLQQDARGANVALPPDYGFSFTAERNRVTFAPGSLDPLSVQLGEVQVISEILFDAQINSLDGVQRQRVSDDDTAGTQSDYIDESSQTNDFAVLTPYQITFRAHTPEIAEVLGGFENSPHGFIVKGINVQRAEGTSDATGAAATPAPAEPAMMPAMPGGRGGLQTVLKEQLLRVTIEVEIVKLSPGN